MKRSRSSSPATAHEAAQSIELRTALNPMICAGTVQFLLREADSELATNSIRNSGLFGRSGMDSNWQRHF